MKGFKKSFISLLLAMTLLVGGASCVFASNTANNAYSALCDAITDGSYPCSNESPYVNTVSLGYDTKTYKTSGGGYALWSELMSGDSSTIINEGVFKTLTAGAKQDFLEDMMTICNAAVWETENKGLQTTNGITSETVTDVMDVLQQRSGMGSQLLATLLANTRPDYVTANRIYAPFSGPIGVVLGLISILVMALLGVTMALDIAYIVIPAFQLLLDGDTDGNQQGGTKGMSKIISAAARNAVSAANNDGGGGGQTGSGNKMALGVYFKYRWKELIVLGICLLYLVQGEIYSFVAWILDLVSGTLGF